MLNKKKTPQRFLANYFLGYLDCEMTAAMREAMSLQGRGPAEIDLRFFLA